LTVEKHVSNDNGSFPFSLLYHRQDHYLTWLYEWHGGYLIRNRNCLPFAIT